jgi:hypothetical protein
MPHGANGNAFSFTSFDNFVSEFDPTRRVVSSFRWVLGDDPCNNPEHLMGNYEGDILFVHCFDDVDFWVCVTKTQHAQVRQWLEQQLPWLKLVGLSDS